MALHFGTLHTELPVRLQLGDGELVEIGAVTLTSTDANGEFKVDQRPIAALLRAAADEIEHPAEDADAAS